MNRYLQLKNTILGHYYIFSCEDNHFNPTISTTQMYASSTHHTGTQSRKEGTAGDGICLNLQKKKNGMLSLTGFGVWLFILPRISATLAEISLCEMPSSTTHWGRSQQLNVCCTVCLRFGRLCLFALLDQAGTCEREEKLFCCLRVRSKFLQCVSKSVSLSSSLSSSPE